DLPLRVAADEVVQELDPCRLRVIRIFPRNAKSTSCRCRSHAVAVDDVIGQRDRMVPGHIDTVPLVAEDRIVDEVVRSAVGIAETHSVTAVAIYEIVDDQRARIPTGNRDTAVARTAAVAKNPVQLNVNVLILIV